LTRVPEQSKSAGDAGTVPGLRRLGADFERFMEYEAFADRARRFGTGSE
jgi:hypothetical protein